jgi:hypothetical protein
LLTAFQALEHFRTLSPDRVRSAAAALCNAWEAIHGATQGIAETYGILKEAWYSPVRERQKVYRTQLEHVGACFSETPSAGDAE